MPVVVNTELGAGLQSTRGLKNLEPGDVADAIVDALQHGVVDVWVPRSAAHTHRFDALLPRRAQRGRGPRAQGRPRPHGRRQAARAAYELRAAHSEPGLEPGEEPRQLTS